YYIDGGIDTGLPQTNTYINRVVIDSSNSIESPSTTANIDRGITGWVTTGTGTYINRVVIDSSNSIESSSTTANIDRGIDTGWVTTGTGTSVVRSGSTNSWNNPSQIEVDDKSFADTYITTLGGYTDWLRAANFDFSSIPVGATLDGIEVRIKRYAYYSNEDYDDEVYLISNTAQVGDNKSKATPWRTTAGYYTYGGPTDTWNSGLTISDIKTINFGVELSALTVVPYSYLYVDSIQIKVYYTESGSSTTSAEEWVDTSKTTAQDDDSTYVSFNPSSTVDDSDWLRLTNFSLSIPSGATITGIEVQMDKQATQGSSIRDGSLYLRKTDRQVGNDKAETINYWDTVDDDAYDIYGGPTDLWGTTWTRSEINSVDFGIDLYVKYFGTVATDARIDHVIIKVYYDRTFNGRSWSSTGNAR
ncbi:hypothetical protein LCGC14_2773800, partial [marine sediment metagenome]